MNYIRTIESQILEHIMKKPITIIYGARQVGKTTLTQKIMGNFEKPLYIAGDDPKMSPMLSGKSGSELRAVLAGYDLVVIDEAQKIQDIGTILKLIADQGLGIPVIATGSSAFELANKISEPLTGRNRKYKLYPLSLPELVLAYGELLVKNHLAEYIIYGNYPAVVAESTIADKKNQVKELARDYLFKDLFLFGDIRNPFALQKLLQLLALQIGSEVSYAQLAKELGISRETVVNYVDLLERAFIIFRLTPLYTNKIKEINKNHKIYFYDTGIRNAILGNFDDLALRNDRGALFENYFIAEKLKQMDYGDSDLQPHFWKGRQDGEIDFVVSDGMYQHMFAYECKYNDTAKIPSAFHKQYPNAEFSVVTLQNIVEHFVAPDTHNEVS